MQVVIVRCSFHLLTLGARVHARSSLAVFCLCSSRPAPHGMRLITARENFDYVGHISRVRRSQAADVCVPARGTTSVDCAYSAVSLAFSEGTRVLRSIRTRAPEVTASERNQAGAFFRGIWRMLSGYWGAYNTYCRAEVRKQLDPARAAAGDAMRHFIHALDDAQPPCVDQLMHACMLGFAARDAVLGCLRSEVGLHSPAEDDADGDDGSTSAPPPPPLPLPPLRQVAIGISRMPGHEISVLLLARGVDMCAARRMYFVVDACREGLWSRGGGGRVRKLANWLGLCRAHANFRHTYFSYVRQCIYDEREFIAYYTGDNAMVLRLILEPRLTACC